MAIASAVATPRVWSALNAHRLERAARQVAADIAHARQQAIARSKTVTITFDLAADAYTITPLKHRDHPSQTYRTVLAGPPFKCDLETVTSATLAFDRFGTPSGGLTVGLLAGGTRRSVVVEPNMGRTSLP